jgi:hypothetical protein
MQNRECKMQNEELRCSDVIAGGKFDAVFILRFSFSVLHFSLPCSTPSPLAPG